MAGGCGGAFIQSVDAIRPEDFAELIRRSVELEHDVRVLAKRFEAQEGALAALTRGALVRSAESLEEGASHLRAAARVGTLVSFD